MSRLGLPSFTKSHRAPSANQPGKTEEFQAKPFISLTSHSVIYRQLRSNLNLLLNFPQNLEKFPGTLPVSLMREDISKLYNSSTTYAVLEKTDGIRYLMFFTLFKLQPVVLLIDRGFQYQLVVDVLAYEELFAGTLLDVEYVTSGRFHHFWIFDVLAFRGKSNIDKTDQHFINRIHTANIVVKHLIGNFKEINGIEFHVKQPAPIHELKKFIEYDIPKRKALVPIDGLILIPLENPYKMGQDFETFKWKNGNDHTAEFQLRLPHTPPKNSSPEPLHYSSQQVPIELWVDNSPHQTWKFYTKSSLDLSKLAKYECKNLLDIDQKIVECRLINKQWQIEKIRRDKKMPNHLVTVQKTEQNIAENILLAELYCQCSDCQVPVSEK